MAEKETFSKPVPLIIDAKAAEKWRKFLMRFEIYRVATEKEKKSDKLKVNLLLICASAMRSKSIVISHILETKAPTILRLFVRNLTSYVNEQKM